MKTTNITKAAALTVLSGLFIGTLSAYAGSDELQQMEPAVFDMGTATAVVYYTETDTGDFEVVTTIGPNVGHDAPIQRYASIISAGERTTVTIDDLANASHSLMIAASRHGVSVEQLEQPVRIAAAE